MKDFLKVCLGLFLVFAFVVTGICVAAAFLLPKKYFSKVTMEVRPDVAAGLPDPAAAGQRRPYDPQFVQAQFAVLQKTEILYPVIAKLDLTNAYAAAGQTLTQEEACTRLRDSMRLQEVRNTGLIEIGVYDSDSVRAANIANSIALTYQDKRREAVDERVRRQLDPIQTKLTDQRQKVEDAVKKAMEIRAHNGITDPDPDRESAAIGIAPSTPNPDAVQNATAGQPDTAAKAKMTEYVEAKHEALHEQKLLEEDELAYEQAKMTQVMQPQGATIWEKAEAAANPQNAIITFLQRVVH